MTSQNVSMLLNSFHCELSLKHSLHIIQVHEQTETSRMLQSTSDKCAIKNSILT